MQLPRKSDTFEDFQNSSSHGTSSAPFTMFGTLSSFGTRAHSSKPSTVLFDSNLIHHSTTTTITTAGVSST